MKNILQIDVEDWYCDLDVAEWPNKKSRVEPTTEKILSLLRETKNKATFFVLGYIAERHPQLIRKIKEEGHEIATHGYAHRRIDEQTPEEFEKDLIQSIKILEGLSGKKVKGYRAPQFTITRKTYWALEIMEKVGLEYDSSIFPVKTPLYGIPDAPLYPHKVRIDEHRNLMEIPPSVWQIPLTKKRLPFSGGIYLRILPDFFIKQAIRKINKREKPAVLFIHPSDIDREKPKLKPKSFMEYYKFGGIKDSLRWYHYYGLGKSEVKFKRLLESFTFQSTEDWIKNERG